MTDADDPRRDPPSTVLPALRRMPDGTVKQRHPFTGTEVWTVPGRAHRPLGALPAEPQPLDPADHGRHCAFCEQRYLETPPEHERLVRRGDGRLEHLRHVSADQLVDTVAEFRRVPNLFAILTPDYWRLAHGQDSLPGELARRDAYLGTDAGREHVRAVLASKLRAGGHTDADLAAMGEEDWREEATAFFASSHDLIIARRHFIDGAQTDHDLAGSGTLTPEEHRAFIALTARSARELLERGEHVRAVAVFQNWLRPAGATFDHLHKQLVAIDELGPETQAVLARLAERPDATETDLLDVARANDLVIAENDHATMIAGFGHRFPSIEIISRSPVCEPWAQSPEVQGGMADLLHAAHAATGADVPSNEEWHLRPPGSDAAMPWRIVLKWRVSTPAGFEGATQIYLTILTPDAVRDRVRSRLRELHAQGRIDPAIRLAPEKGTP